MKSKLPVLIIVLSSLLFSCETDSKNANSTNENQQEKKIDSFLNNLLNNKYKNYESNDLVRQKALKELLNHTDSLLPIGILEDFPLRVFRVKPNPHGKGAIVQLYTERINEGDQLSNRIQFDVIGLIDEKNAESIQENETYFITGKKYKRLSSDEAYAIVNQSYYSHEPSIQKDVTDISKYNYQIGNFLCEIESITIAR